MESSRDKSLHFTAEQCHSVNNIEFVLQSMHTFPQQLGIDTIADEIDESHGALVGEACRRTIKMLVQNAVENVENQIHEVSVNFSKCI